MTARILLIDDDPALRAGIGRYLEAMGYQVFEADNGESALKVLEANTLDLVLTDINMPEMDGIELILALAERFPHIPIITMSGGGLIPKEHLLADARMLGVLRTIAKPFDLDELGELVEQVLAEAG